MCQAKSKGGKRCFAHMLGTQASVIMASIMGNVPQEHAKKVSSELRKEGKGLPAPTEEEILAFARNNQFISRHDVTIPDNMRAGLVKRWQKAEMERPDGGGFHAWKHVLVESVVRYRRTAAAVGLAGLMTFSTACSGGQDIGNAPENTSSPSPSISQTAPAGPSIAGGQVIKTDKGEYLQSTIADDDPAMKYDSTKATDEAKAQYTEDELKEAQKITSKYVAEEMIDSPLNNSAVSVDTWWTANKDKFDPNYHAETKKALDDGQGPVIRNLWQEERKDTYSYVYSPTETRVFDRNMQNTKTYISPNGKVLVFDGEFNYKAKIQNPADPSAGYATESTSGTYSLGLIKSESSPSGWVITGYQFNATIDDVSAGIK